MPTVLHEQNGVMGRANRLLAPRVTRDRHRLSHAGAARPAAAGQRPSSPAIRCAPRGDRRRARRLMPRRQRADTCACWCSAAARARVSWPRSCRRRSSGLSGRCARACRSCSRRAPRTSTPCARTYARLGVAAEMRAVLLRPAGAHGGGASGRSRAPAPRRWPSSPPSAGRRSWCRCRMRSIRTSSPMPGVLEAAGGAIRDRAARLHARAPGRGDHRPGRRPGAACPHGGRPPNRPAPSTPPSGWPIWC